MSRTIVFVPPRGLNRIIDPLRQRRERAAAVLFLLLVVLLPAAYIAGLVTLWAALSLGALSAFVALRFNPGKDADHVDVDQLINHVRPGRKLAILDPQTTLLQRWYFDLRLAEELERCRRHGFKMAVLFIQMDPQEVSGLSHETPEDRAAQIFVRTVRRGDLAVKIDHRTYGLCLTHSDESQARAAIRRLLGSLNAIESPDVALAMCPADGSDIASLLAAARPVDLKEPIPLERRPRRAEQQLGKLFTSQSAGEIRLRQDETVAQAKARARRASRRAGVSIKVWEEAGVLRFERVDQNEPAQAGAA